MKYDDKNIEQLLDERSADIYYDYYNASYINLKLYPPQLDLLSAQDIDVYVELDFIPWKIINGMICVVAASKSDKLISFLIYKYHSFALFYAPHKKIRRYIQLKFSYYFLNKVKDHLYSKKPSYSAYCLFKNKHKLTIWLSVLTVIMVIILYPDHFFSGFIYAANIVFFLNTVLKIALFFIASPSNKKSLKRVKHKEIEWPLYTLLLPLYKEDYAVISLLKSIKLLDYPKDKLDIKLIVEQFDCKTISFLRRLEIDESIHIICVPASAPKTKSKACSYALQFAKGEYIAIYDAEDKPEVGQLKKVITAFNNSPEEVVCVQSRLNFYNRKENLLASFFAIEYSLLFDFYLWTLEKFDIPLPLGGSSNHFKLSKLIEVGGWDPYNVTEDADIGFRLALYGYKAKMIQSVTMEEAPIRFDDWINQRTRWIKGHLQTCLVHSRNLKQAIKKIGLIGITGFYCFLLLPIVSYLMQLIILAIGCFYLLNIYSNNYSKVIFLFSCLNICLWFLTLYFSVLIVKFKNNWYDLKWSLLLFPFYYLLHPFASFKAVFQLIKRPYYWHKTNHDYYKRHNKQYNQ